MLDTQDLQIFHLCGRGTGLPGTELDEKSFQDGRRQVIYKRLVN